MNREEGKEEINEEKSLSCSLTFQNAIEIDFSKLREMARESTTEEALSEALSSSPSQGISDDMADPLSSASVVGRDLSVYDKPSACDGPDSSDDEGEDGGLPYNGHNDEPETEVENSEDNSDENDSTMQYEQLGSTECTQANSDDEDAQSDGEFGDFESCTAPQTHTSNNQTDNPSYTSTGSRHDVEKHTDGQQKMQPLSRNESDHCPTEDNTQDLLAAYHPRTPAKAIPPLDADKIALIKQTMAGLTLKPPSSSGAARVADAVIKSRPRVGDEVTATTST